MTLTLLSASSPSLVGRISDISLVDTIPMIPPGNEITKWFDAIWRTYPIVKLPTAYWLNDNVTILFLTTDEIFGSTFVWDFFEGRSDETCDLERFLVDCRWKLRLWLQSRQKKICNYVCYITSSPSNEMAFLGKLMIKDKRLTQFFL